MRRILPYILATLTQHDRYLPEIEWSSKSWVHNIFRTYELIFWRRVGIKAEMSSSFDGKVATYQAHSFEAVCALAETYIRNFARFRTIRIWIPMLVTTTGLPVPASPFLFAIALDTTSQGTYDTASWSHTFTGSNLIGISGGAVLGSPAGMTETINSASATLLIDSSVSGGSAYLFYKIAPSTGSQTVAVAGFGVDNYAFTMHSYSGVKQTGFPDAQNYDTSSSAALTVAVTVVASNCWLFGVGVVSNGTPSCSTNRTDRQNTFLSNSPFTKFNLTTSDSNGTVGTGSQSIIFTPSGGASTAGCGVVSFAPVAAAGSSKFFQLF